ncbi:hypothetical protein RF11_07175 [Thelohanellus kitauei]|uniref:Uncharacterized protein n=1 Tax=Thelohanellus kitauei TaxID=669202 RepID=A0A0C2NJP3_THEKT|nr:hypothetical protein RF11_07175 [Thelohanellus kitauei]
MFLKLNQALKNALEEIVEKDILYIIADGTGLSVPMSRPVAISLAVSYMRHEIRHTARGTLTTSSIHSDSLVASCASTVQALNHALQADETLDLVEMTREYWHITSEHSRSCSNRLGQFIISENRQANTIIKCITGWPQVRTRVSIFSLKRQDGLRSFIEWFAATALQSTANQDSVKACSFNGPYSLIGGPRAQNRQAKTSQLALRHLRE